MNRDQELTVRRWLEARDPGPARAELRERTHAIALETPAARFPRLDLTLRGGFGLAPIARPLAIALLVLLAAVVAAGALLLQPWRPFPPRGLLAFTAPLATTGTSGIVLVEADGTGRHQITPKTPNLIDQSPRWSADGKSLLFGRTSDLNAFGSCPGVGSVVVYDVPSGTERTVATDLPPIGTVEWSPSGNGAAFITPGPGCGANVYLGNVDIGTGEVTMTLVHEQDSEVALIPGGDLWHLEWHGDTAVAVQDAMSSENGRDFTATIDVRSHGGGSLVRYAWTTPERIPALVAIHGATGASTALGLGGLPAWSPDDKAIAFIRPGGKTDPNDVNYVRDTLVVVSTDTWQARTLLEVQVADLPPADALPALGWTSDGGAIYWLSPTGWVEVVDVVTGRSTRIDGFGACNDLQ